MKKRKQAKVRKHNSRVWIVGLIVAAALIGGYFLFYYDQTTTEETTTTAPQSVIVPVSRAILNEEMTLTESPFVRTVNMNEGRYDVSFEADKKIKFVLYSETRYNEWRNSGEHTLSKISTQHGSECCAISGNYRIDINEGEAGTYYFVFEDVQGLGMSSGKIVINKVGELGR